MEPNPKAPRKTTGLKTVKSPGPHLLNSPVTRSKPAQKTIGRTSPILSFNSLPREAIPSSVKSSMHSKTGMNPDDPRKTNQDSCFIIQNFNDNPDCHLFGVCDGHGQYGGEISSFIKDRLPQLLSSQNFLENIPQAISSAIHILQSEILKKKYDTTLSGSTLNLVVLSNNRVICANIGDSRAVLARKEQREWKALSLSRDHKPTIPEEKKRIEMSGGRVGPFLDENGAPFGPPRVWVNNKDYPGIAVSRTLGDSVAAAIGVFSEPEITERVLQDSDKFIVMGSDGLFEFIQNEEIVHLASGHVKGKNPESICNYLVRIADERWRKEEESVDDITCVCVLLKFD